MVPTTWIHAIISWLSSLCPFVLKRRAEEEIQRIRTFCDNELRVAEEKYQQREKITREGHKRDLERTTGRVDQLIDRLSELEFIRRDAGLYAVSVTFDPRMLGPSTPYELQLIGSRVARHIEREIASSRFVQSAHDRGRIMAQPSRFA